MRTTSRHRARASIRCDGRCRCIRNGSTGDGDTVFKPVPVDSSAFICADDVGIDHGDGEVARQSSIECGDGDAGFGSDVCLGESLTWGDIRARECERKDRARGKGGEYGGDNESLGEVGLDSLNVNKGRRGGCVCG